MKRGIQVPISKNIILTVSGGRTIKKNFVRVIAMLVLSSFLLTSCASYTSIALPQKDVTTLNQFDKINNVYVGVSFMDKAECQRYFDADLIDKGVQPIYMVIENGSEKTYLFSKESIGIPKMDSLQASEKGERSTAGRIAGYGALSLILWPFLIPAIADGISSSNANKSLRADYESKQIADGPIRPRVSRYGVFFSPVLQSGEEISISLIEQESKESLVFRFRR